MRPSFSNQHGGTFVLVEPGEFMGFVLAEPIFVGARPVTQVEWLAIMGSNPSKFQDGWSSGLRPVDSVNFFDCKNFISKLNLNDNEPKLGLEGSFRLPTKEEWEYFCRAGSSTKWHHSDRDNEIDEVAWHAGNSGATTREVGQKAPNDWGLYDLHGNISEWTTTLIDDKYVTKGGSWLTESESTRVTADRLFLPTKRSDSIGLRLIWSPN